jgi:hypothetical protein
VRAQWLTVDAVIPQFAPMRVHGQAYFLTLGVPSVVDLLQSLDATWDLAFLTVHWHGVSRWLTTESTYDLVMGYDDLIGYNAYFLRIDFSNGTNAQVRLDPSRPQAWSATHPLAVPGQTTVHLPFMFDSFGGCDLWPVPYH